MAKIDLSISYVDTDRSWAEWIAWQFEEEGYTTQLQAWDQRPDTDFLASIKQAVATADLILIVLSRSSWRVTQRVTREPVKVLHSAIAAAEGSLVLVAVDYSPLLDSLGPLKAIDLMDLPERWARDALLDGVLGKGRRKPTEESQLPRPGFTKPRFPGYRPALRSRLPQDPTASASEPSLRDTSTSQRDRVRRKPEEQRDTSTSQRDRVRRKPEEQKKRHPIPVHVHARMDPELVVGQAASVQVVVSREQIRHVDWPTEVSGQASANAERSVVVEVIGRANLTVDGPNRREVPIPASGEPRLLLFDVRATHAGACELWVVARQGPLPLLTLVLRPQLRNEPSSLASTRQEVAVGAAAIEPSGEPPLTVLRIYEERHGNAVVYRYDLDAPQWGFTRTYASRLIEQDRDAYVRSLFRRIEDIWVTSGEDAAAFQEQLRAFGAELLDELVPVELQRDLWAYRKPLAHIVVLSTEPFIPWELVHLKDPDAGRLPTETRFLAQLGLVRWLWQPQQPGRQANVRLPVELRIRPGRARFIIPDYPDLAWRLAAPAAEQAFLEDQLGAARVLPHHAEVLALLRDPDAFDLLHFAGHGRAASDSIADAQLLLEGRVDHGQYKPEPLPVAVVRHNFRTAVDTSAPIVVLNACQTGRLGHQLAGIGGFAEAFVGGGAGAFISSLWSVGDSPASVFVEALYQTLMAGKTMADAVRAARARAQAAGDATWLAYTVYAHPRARVTFGPPHPTAPPEPRPGRDSSRFDR